MTNTKNTKRALLASALALFVCVSMLVGSTFAWFTDNASATGNKIQSGKLDVTLEMKNANGEWVDAEGEQLKWLTEDTVDNVLWEPGCTYKLPELKIENKGNLALKYEVIITGITGDAELLDVIDFTGIPTGVAHLKPGEFNTFTIEGHMDEAAGNEYQEKTIEDISITVNATQDAVEKDSYDNQYDANIAMSTPAKVEADAKVSTSDVELTLSSDFADALADAGINEVSLVHTVAEVDADNNTVTFNSVELIDEDGNKVDVEGPRTITLPVPSIAEGTTVAVLHDGEFIASATVTNGKITYTANHLCEIAVQKATIAADAVEIDTALKNGENVFLADNIKFSAADTTASTGYGATGIMVNGSTFDGNGKTLTVDNAWSTWDCSISIKSGTIKNVKINSAMRGIFMGSADGDVFIDNVVIDGPVYTFNSDGGNSNYGVYISNTTLNGWTSFSNVHKEVIFTDCNFGEGQGYAFCRPYNSCVFKNCVFEEGFEFDTAKTANIVFENCYYGDTLITAENAASLGSGDTTLFYNGLNQATIK